MERSHFTVGQFLEDEKEIRREQLMNIWSLCPKMWSKMIKRSKQKGKETRKAEKEKKRWKTLKDSSVQVAKQKQWILGGNCSRGKLPNEFWMETFPSRNCLAKESMFFIFEVFILLKGVLYLIFWLKLPY